MQPSAGELERLRGGKAERDSLRQELESLLQSVGLPDSEPISGLTAYPPGAWVPLAACTDCGHATPVAALETLLWAQKTGNLDSLLESFVLEGDTRVRAGALFSRLSGDSQNEYGTPERMVAALMVKGPALAEIQLFALAHPAVDRAVGYAMVKGVDEQDRTADYSFRLGPDGWLFSPRADLIDRLAPELAAEPKSPASAASPAGPAPIAVPEPSETQLFKNDSSVLH
jgi:hypothetical protein